MKNTPFEGYSDLRLPPEAQLRRLRRVIREELTDRERDTLRCYYKEGKKIPQIAEEMEINRSTVWRNLKRAEEKLRRFLRY